MIAVDELPSSIRILGVPATITPAGTQNMISLGLKERSSQLYVVQFAEDIQTTSDGQKIPTISNKQLEEEKEVVKEPGQVETKSAKTVGAESSKAEDKDIDELKANAKGKQVQGVEAPLAEQVGSWRERIHKENEVNGNRPTIITPEKTKNTKDDTSSANGISKASPDSPPTNLPSKAAYGGMGTTGTLGKKVYCTHWIRWGECDYTQQGCLYKHEMPDEKKLHEIGIATYPRWYRIANPEKFNGETEGPVWHRRPGPAPTDQLWRGPPPARPVVEPQTYEDFRSNARPASTQGPIQRQQFGARSNAGSGPIIFAYDPIGSTFHPLAAFNNFRSHATEQTPRQSYGRIPPARVVNMPDPFARQQRSTFTGTSSNPAEQTNPSAFAGATTNADSSVSFQPQGSIVEINESASADRRSEQPLKQSIATTHTDNVRISNTSQSSPSKTGPSTNESGSAEKSSSSSASGSSPPKMYHNSKFNSHSMTNCNHVASNYGQDQSRNGYAKGSQNLNEAYQPLVPSRVSRSAPVNDEKPTIGMEKRFVPAPATPPPVHRRFFVPPGHSMPTASTNGASGHSSANGGSGSNGASRKAGNVLVDI